MLTRLERSVATSLRPFLHRPARVRETATLAAIQTKERVAYPGELKRPRRMDIQFALPRRNGHSFFLNVEINRGSAYSELKRSRMLDPHLVERCDRVYGHSNYLNVLIVGTQIDQKSQRYRELERYFTPDRTHNLWVIMCSEAFGPADIEFIGEKLREMSRKVMGLD